MTQAGHRFRLALEPDPVGGPGAVAGEQHLQGHLTRSYETGLSARDLDALADVNYAPADVGATIASGSFRTMGMVVAPCSIRTLAEIASCATGSLLTRAADVCLKERRRVVLLVRETPLHAGHLRAMLGATEMGAVVMPPVPAFYTRPRTIQDIVDHTAARALDLFDVEVPNIPRWSGQPEFVATDGGPAADPLRRGSSSLHNEQSGEEYVTYVLREVLAQAQAAGAAIGHFNVADLVLLKAVFASARELKVPVLVGASEGEREFLGTCQLAALVRSLREEFDFPSFLNADHTHSLAKAVDAVKAGFDAVVFDLSALPFEQNVRQIREAVEALKGINPSVLVEGEIGDIGTGSEIHDRAPDLSRGLTTPNDARQFVESTGIDILAPAVGNVHGMLESMVHGDTRKRLDIERICHIKAAARVLLTLHGGSGTDDDDLRNAIAAGINIVHINTELRVAWRRGLEDSLAKQPGEVVPYRILPAAVDAVKKVTSSRLKLFNERGRLAFPS
jgi:fructose-bisphosphate aldolase class II